MSDEGAKAAGEQGAEGYCCGGGSAGSAGSGVLTYILFEICPSPRFLLGVTIPFSN